jgi:hypothetical protein
MSMSPNQMNMAIVRGQAPRGIVRIDTPRVPHEQVHATLDTSGAVNMDGTWKHKPEILTKAQADWLRSNGWHV